MVFKKSALLLVLLLGASYEVHAKEPKRVSVNVILEEKDLINELTLGAIDGAIMGVALTFLLQLSVNKNLDYNVSINQYKMNTLINAILGAFVRYCNACKHNVRIEKLARTTEDKEEMRQIVQEVAKELTL